MSEEIEKCFLCKVKFNIGDDVVEFFGGYAHFSCFDKKMEENKKREEENKK